jgi:hypothetical protein
MLAELIVELRDLGGGHALFAVAPVTKTQSGVR